MRQDGNSIINNLEEVHKNNNITQFMNYEIVKLGKISFTPAHILFIIFIFFLSWFVVKVLRRILVGRRKSDDVEFGRRYSLYMILKYLVYTMCFVFCFQAVGISLNALLVGSAALLVGIGMGLQNIFSDLVSGLFLLFERPIEIGDVIEVDGIIGRIHTIKLRHTLLEDRDGVNLIVPNHKFIQEKVINWSHNAEERRFDVKVGVDYASDVNVVREVLKRVVSENKFVIIDDERFPVIVRLIDFGDSALMFSVLFWTRNIFLVENVKSDIRYAIFDEFRKEGIKIPFPQRDVHLFQAGS